MDVIQKNLLLLHYCVMRGLKGGMLTLQNNLAVGHAVASIEELGALHISTTRIEGESEFGEIEEDMATLDSETGGRTLNYSLVLKELFSIAGNPKKLEDLGLDKPLKLSDVDPVIAKITQGVDCKNFGDAVQIPAGPPENRAFLPDDLG